jgi:2,3-bisphosphoglycerate-independent phosphoglycerate mutase
MKYAIVIPDGCADEPQDSLGQRTPLQAATIPEMDEIARLGHVGLSNHVPAEFTPGSEVANMSLLGYDPRDHFTGRAPIEAQAQGIHLEPSDWAVRCNLVQIVNQVMRDFTAGHISSAEGSQLLKSLQAEVDPSGLEFVPGVSYRNLLIVRGESFPSPFTEETRTVAPHDLTDQVVRDAYPRGPGSDLLASLMQTSERVFADHRTNMARAALGKATATHVWLWGLGKAPQLPSFHSRFGLHGAMITAVDLLRGLARLIGWNCIEVPGATGYLDTDYAAKGRYAVEAIDNFDLVCVHVEATDEASHEGRADAKVAALEEIDRHIIGPVHAALRRHGEYRIWITPDHPTFLRTKMHSHGYVPWTICGSGVHADAATTFDERAAESTGWRFEEGHQQMRSFLCRE